MLFNGVHVLRIWVPIFGILRSYFLRKRYFVLYFMLEMYWKTFFIFLASFQFTPIISCTDVNHAFRVMFFCLENAVLQFVSCRFHVLLLQVSTVQCSLLGACCVLFQEVSVGQEDIIYLFTSYQDDSKFIVPETATISQGEAKGNSCC